MTMLADARVPHPGHRWHFDWRVALVLVIMTASFIGVLTFPQVVPFTYIWATAVATAAFAPPRTTLAVGILAASLTILGYVIAGNTDFPIMWLRISGLCVPVAVSYIIARRRSRIETQLRAQATTDPLTGLANRRLLTERLEAQLLLPRTQASCAVIYADLDDFKAINDEYGHAVGDAVLIDASARLLDCADSADTVARVGGDEFILAIPVVHDSALVTELCDGIVRAFEAPFPAHDLLLRTRISLGVAIGSASSSFASDQLIDAADRALRESKLSARGSYSIVRI